MSSPNRFTMPMKVMAVRMMAESHTHDDIVEEINNRFNCQITKRQLQLIQPKSHKAPKKLVQLFYDTQKKFLEKVADDYPISKISYRLNRLQQLEQKAIDDGDRDAHLKILKQAAQEVGNAFNNRVELSGIDGSPIKIQHEFRKLSDEELQAEIRQMIDMANNVIDVTPKLEEDKG